MAWQIVKESFGILRSRFKSFIIPCVLFLLLTLLDMFFTIPFPLSSPILYIAITLCSEIPFFCILNDKNPMHCFRENWRSLLIAAVLFTAVIYAVKYMFTFLSNNETRIVLNIIDDLVSMFLSLVMNFILIEIIKNNSGIKYAGANVAKTLSSNIWLKTWLWIKIILIEEIISMALFFVFFIIVLAVPTPSISHMLNNPATVVFLEIAYTFIYTYIIIRTDYYYAIISLLNNKRPRE